MKHTHVIDIFSSFIVFGKGSFFKTNSSTNLLVRSARRSMTHGVGEVREL